MAKLLSLGCSSILRCRFASANSLRCNHGVTSADKRRRVDFSHAREALKSKTTIDLLKSYLIYSLFKYDTFVDNSFKV